VGLVRLEAGFGWRPASAAAEVMTAPASPGNKTARPEVLTALERLATNLPIPVRRRISAAVLTIFLNGAETTDRSTDDAYTATHGITISDQANPDRLGSLSLLED
jgi:hypothetical protein